MTDRRSPVKTLLAAAALASLLGTAPAQAQSEMDHRVQRAWDNVFNPPPPGDPRTNFERRRDAARYGQNQAARQARWCHNHVRSTSCDRYYGRY